MDRYSIIRDGVCVSKSSARPALVLASVLRNRELIRELIKRDVIGRYRASFGGVLWSFAHPIFMLAVYTLAFGVFFKVRWGGADSTLEFSLVLFAGLIIYNFFAECINRAPALVLNRPGFVKKVVFPLEILPWVAMGSALFHTAVSFLAWIFFYIALHGVPPLTLFWAPVVLLPLLPVVLGLSWALSALGVYVRDVIHIVGIVTLALLFLSPVFFSLDAVPESLRPLILANPLTLIIDQARQVMLYGAMPDFRALGLYSIFSLGFGWAGFALFQMLRDGFADAI